MKPSTFALLSSLVAERTGIVVRAEKQYLLEARLAPLCRRHGFAGIDGLALALAQNDAVHLVDEILDAMTTNETSFFRDGAPFDVLAHTVLPRLIEARRSAKRLRIWSAACSSGQEIYSIAMLLVERFPELADWRVELLATDLSPTMVTRTADGSYSKHEVARGLTPERLERHFFQASETEYLVDPSLKRWVTVRQHNLLDPLRGEEPFDLVVLRNVLIYFAPDVRDRVLGRIQAALRPDGLLMLGTAETPDERQFDRADVAASSFFHPRPPRAA